MNKLLRHIAFLMALGCVSYTHAQLSSGTVNQTAGSFGLNDTVSATLSFTNTIPNPTGDPAPPPTTITVDWTATLQGRDIYGNEVVIPVTSGVVRIDNQASETVEAGFRIPNDGTLARDGYRFVFDYTYTVPGDDPVDGRKSGNPNIDIDQVLPNLVLENLEYRADTYEGGEILLVTYTFSNRQAANFTTQPRPLTSRASDVYRSSMFLTLNPRLDRTSDFRLGESVFAGDEGFFIADSRTVIRSIEVVGTPGQITTFGRDYYPAADDGFLDIGETLIVTEEYLIPYNFAGTYFLAGEIDSAQRVPEQQEGIDGSESTTPVSAGRPQNDNILVSDTTPRIRIIGGPSSNTRPVSEVTDQAGVQVAEANSASLSSSISEDGLYVAFSSFASNLTPGEDFNYNGFSQIFLRNTLTNEVKLISQNNAGQIGNGNSSNPQISADGRYIVYESSASNLVNGDTNGFSDIFVRDLELGVTTRISVTEARLQANGASFAPAISEDGRIVAFESSATNLDPGVSSLSGRVQVYVINRDVDNTGFYDQPGNISVRLASVNSDGNSSDRNVLQPALSLDGNVLAFVTNGSNFPSANGFNQIYLRNLANGIPTGNNPQLVSRASGGSGAVGNGHSGEPAINGGRDEPNGLQIVFSSLADNLVPNDTNGISDIFVRNFGTSPVSTLRLSQSNERVAYGTIRFISGFPDGQPPTNNPPSGSFVTLSDAPGNSETFTFRAFPILPNDVLIGLTSGATRDNLVAAINASTTINLVAEATNADGFFTGLTIYNPVPGVAGNQPIITSGAPIFANGMSGAGVQSVDFASGASSPLGSLQPSIDRSGAIVAFRSLSSNMAVDKADGQFIRPLLTGTSNVWLHNRDISKSGTLDDPDNTTTLQMSVSRFGYPTFRLAGVASSGSSRFPSVSANGIFVSFTTDSENTGGLRFGATNLDPEDNNGVSDIFLYTLDSTFTPAPPPVGRPIVEILTPGAGDSVTVGQRVNIEARVVPVGSSNPVTVDFFANGELVQSVSTPPYVASWNPSEPGDVSLVARATEPGVGVGVSPAVTVVSQPNNGLSVRILSPTNGTGVALGNTIQIQVEASAQIGSVSYVQIQQNGQFINNPSGSGEDATRFTTAPYTVEFTPTSVGPITLTATVTGNSGQTARDTISITVATNPPNVVITSPSAGDTIPLGQEVTVTASASSDLADISQVEFFVDGVSIGIDRSFPYAARFTPSSAGSVSIQAFSTDSEGVRSGTSITVQAANMASSVVLTSPTPGTQFSIYAPQQVAATVQSAGRQVRVVDFLANGVLFSSSTFSPFRGEFDPETQGDYMLTARVTFSDGTRITSPAVPVQAIYNPLVTTDDFIAQSFTDLFGEIPSQQVVAQASTGVQDTLASKVAFIENIMRTSDFQSGVSVMGAFITQLYRFPLVSEYQAAITGLGFTGSTGATQPIGVRQLAIPSQTQGAIATGGQQDVYSFTIPQAQTVTLFTTGPTDTTGTLRTATGQLIAFNDDGGQGFNFQIQEFLPAGTYQLTVAGFGGFSTGIYTLFAQGTGDVGSGGSVGSSNFNVEGLVAQIYASREYLNKFGNIPDLVGEPGSAGDLNRRALFRQLWFGKLRGTPTALQEQQASIRMVSLGGLNPFTSIFVTEQQIVVSNLATGQSALPQPLIADAGSARGYWSTALLMLAYWNTQPTTAMVDQIAGLPMSQQIEIIITDPRYTSRFPSETSNSLTRASAGTDGWANSPWLGWINTNFEPWYYHDDLSWLYTDAKVADSVWFYSASSSFGWFWTTEGIFPYVYRADNDSWYFYDTTPSGSNTRWFYNYSTNDWESFEFTP